jgi:Uma2 family endonuclease
MGLSPSSADKDLRVKTALFERHGVREQWIVHAMDRTAMVFTLDARGAYGKPRFFGPEDSITSTVFPDLAVDMKAAFLAAE